MGGGTPTVLAPEQLGLLLCTCKETFGFQDEDIEISVEVNPATITASGLSVLRQKGFNRLSIGVQSFVEQELQIIGRVHSGEDARHTCRMARKAGFTNVSMDLMFGLPGQTCASWQYSLEQALGLQPDHLSLYELTLEPGTDLAREADRGGLDLPDEDTLLAMLQLTNRLLVEHGLERYEISNYTKPGYSCSHNVNYWHNGEYYGFGPGAVSCLSGVRRNIRADVKRYCTCIEQGRSVVVGKEILEGDARFRETVIMGLRMVGGISLAELEKRFGRNALTYYGPTLERLLAGELLRLDNGYLHLSRQGLLLANTVMAELV